MAKSEGRSLNGESVAYTIKTSTSHAASEVMFFSMRALNHSMQIKQKTVEGGLSVARSGMVARALYCHGLDGIVQSGPSGWNWIPPSQFSGYRRKKDRRRRSIVSPGLV